MNETAQLFSIISIASGLIGAALLIRAKVADHERRLTSHEDKDEVFHISIIDRLGRIETKIDALTDRGPPT